MVQLRASRFEKPGWSPSDKKKQSRKVIRYQKLDATRAKE